MKIGIIIHSKTGNTLSVAEMLYERFLVAGHTVTIGRITASNDGESNAESVVLTNAPELDGFDMLVFGAPVRGYRLSPVMQAYLRQCPPLKGKIVTGFVTQFFPKSTMGGNQAMKCMDEICLSKGAGIAKSGIINWINPIARKKSIEETVELLFRVSNTAQPI